jgi:hypothetical protein
MADTLDLKSNGAIREGSTPSLGIYLEITDLPRTTWDTGYPVPYVVLGKIQWLKSREGSTPSSPTSYKICATVRI